MFSDVSLRKSLGVDSNVTSVYQLVDAVGKLRDRFVVCPGITIDRELLERASTIRFPVVQREIELNFETSKHTESIDFDLRGHNNNRRVYARSCCGVSVRGAGKHHELVCADCNVVATQIRRIAANESSSSSVSSLLNMSAINAAVGDKGHRLHDLASSLSYTTSKLDQPGTQARLGCFEYS